MRKQIRGTTQQPTSLAKLLPLLLAVVLAAGTLFALTGCGGDNGTEPSGTEGSATDTSGTASVANPVVEVDSVDTINEDLGLNMRIPDGATVESCAIIDNSLGEVNFNLDGQLYNYRGMVTNNDEDISGLYYEFSSTETADTTGQVYVMEYIEGGPGYARWYDDISGTVYSVSVESGATGAMLNEIASTLIAAQKLM